MRQRSRDIKRLGQDDLLVGPRIFQNESPRRLQIAAQGVRRLTANGGDGLRQFAVFRNKLIDVGKEIGPSGVTFQAANGHATP